MERFANNTHHCTTTPNSSARYNDDMAAPAFQMTTRGIFIAMFWGGACLTLGMHGIRSRDLLPLVVPALFLCQCMALGAPFGAARRCAVAGVLLLLSLISSISLFGFVFTFLNALAEGLR